MKMSNRSLDVWSVAQEQSKVEEGDLEEPSKVMFEFIGYMRLTNRKNIQRKKVKQGFV